MNQVISVTLTANTGALRAQLAQAAAAVRGFEAQVRGTSGATAKVGSESQRAASQVRGAYTDMSRSAATHRKSLDAVATGATLVGAGMLAGFGVAVKATMDFDRQLSELGAVTGATGSQMDALRQQALDMGAATSFSATEAALAQTELAKAGISTADIMGGALAGALSLAEAGQIDLGNAATIAANAMTTFNLEGSEVGHVADVLASAANKSAGDVEQFAQGLQQTGLVAANLGLSLEDTVGTLAAFAQAGLKGSDAGTSMKTMLSSFVPKSVEAAEAMRDLGLDFFDASGQFVGIEAAAGQLQSRLIGLTQEQRAAALQTIFGADAVRAATILYNEGEAGISGWVDGVNQTGAASEMAAAKMDNLAGDLEQLRGSIETALIEGGSSATGVLRTMAQGATGAVNAFMDLPGPLQTAATALAGIGGSALVLVGGLGMLVPRVAAGAAAIKGLATAIKGMAVVQAAAAGMQSLATRAMYLGDALSAVFTTGNIGKLSGFRTAFEGLGRAMTSPAFVTAVGAGAIIGLITTMQRAESKAKDLRRELEADIEWASGDSLQASIRETEAQISQLEAHVGGTGNFFQAFGEAARGAVTFGLVDFENQTLEAAASLDELDESLAAQRQALLMYEHDVNTLSNTLGMSSGEVERWLSSIEGYDPRDTSQTTQDLAAAIGEAAAAARVGTPATDAMGDAFGSAGDEASSATDRISALSDAIDALLGVAISARAAEAELAGAIAELGTSVQENGLNFDVWTEAGRANEEALRGNVEAMVDLANARAEETGSVQDGVNVLSLYRQQLLDNLQSMGMTEEAATQLLGTYGLVPDNLETLIALSGATEAQTQAEDLTRRLELIDQAQATGEVDINSEDFDNDEARITAALLQIGTEAPEATVTLNGEQFEPTAAMVDSWLASYDDSSPQAEALLNIVDPASNFPTLSAWAAAWAQTEAAARMSVDTQQAKLGIQSARDDMASWNVTTGTARANADSTNARVNIQVAKDRMANWNVTTGTGRVLADNNNARVNIQAAKDRLANWGASTGTGRANADNSNALSRIGGARSALSSWDAASGTGTANVSDLASATLNRVLGLLNSIDGRTANSTVTTTHREVFITEQRSGHTTGGAQLRWGGVVHARDGFDWDAKISTGPTVHWGERETGGEAYVPKIGNRGRSLGILDTAAGWYGMSLVPTKELAKNGTLSAANGALVSPQTQAALAAIARMPKAQQDAMRTLSKGYVDWGEVSAASYRALRDQHGWQGIGGSGVPDRLYHYVRRGAIPDALYAQLRGLRPDPRFPVSRYGLTKQGYPINTRWRDLGGDGMEALYPPSVWRRQRFDLGGIVDGLPGEAREVIAHGREMVLNAAQQARLFDLANAGALASESIVEAAQRRLVGVSAGGGGGTTVTFAPHIEVTVPGGDLTDKAKVVEVVRGEVRGAFREMKQDYWARTRTRH